MPTYQFYCEKCDDKFEEVQNMGVVKRASVEMLKRLPKRQAKCPACKKVSREQVFSSKIEFIGASVQHAEYNPGLGQVVKNKKHLKDLVREKGLIEIGNEKPETVHKRFDQARAEKLKKSWDDV